MKIRGEPHSLLPVLDAAAAASAGELRSYGDLDTVH